jgi:hypothetical protein
VIALPAASLSPVSFTEMHKAMGIAQAGRYTGLRARASVVRASFVAAGASPVAATTAAAFQQVMDEASVDCSDVARGHNFAMSLEHEVRPQLPPKSEAVVFGR